MLTPHRGRLSPPSQATCFLQPPVSTSSCVVLVSTATMILQHNANTSLYMSAPMFELVRWSVQLSCSNHKSEHPHSFISRFLEHPVTSSTRSRIHLHICISHAQVHEVVSISSATCCPWCLVSMCCMKSTKSIPTSSSICGPPQYEEKISSKFNSRCATSRSIKKPSSYLQCAIPQVYHRNKYAPVSFPMCCLWS